MTPTNTPKPRAFAPSLHPLHVPGPIAKVDGDTQVMAQAYQQRRANEISALGGGFPYVLTYRLERPDLDIAEDVTLCYRTMEALIIALKLYMAKDGTYHFAIAFSGGAINISDVLQPAAPVVDAAPVCGTCGGEGDCMDCDTLPLDNAKALLKIARESLDNPSHSELHPVVKQSRLDTLKAYIANLEAYIAHHAPTFAPDTCGCGNWDCDYCKRDAMRWSKAESAPTDPAPVQTDDIVTRLETRATESAQDDEDPMPYADVLLMFDAAAEIRRLRAEVVSIRNAANVAIDAFQADAEKTRGEIKAVTRERDHYLRGLNEYARNMPWNMAANRDEAEEIAENYARAKADKFSKYAE